MGDLLCAWPALLALSRAFASLPRYAVVRPDLETLPRALGFLPCPAELRTAEDAFHGGELPAAASRCRIFRFCLDTPPKSVPPGAQCLFALPDEELPVSTALASQLAATGMPVPSPEECRKAFREHFGAWSGRESDTAGLFPGSGHWAKNWPPRRFVAAAREFARQGFHPLQILGPAEEERGPLLPGIPARRPADPGELADTLKELRFVLGNDSGPLHLAAWLGVPCAVLFGPSPPKRWGPPGAIIISSPLPCAPCSASLRRLACGRPSCMEAIKTEDVLRAASGLRER
jgi:ADP-heptose:LPS heptosyltransferase